MLTREEMIETAKATTTRFVRLSEFADPMTTFMLCYWKEKKGDRPMPLPADMNLADFARHAPKIFMVQVKRDPFDLTFRLVGEDVIANFGFNPKGRTLRSLNVELPGLGTLLHEFFKWTAAERGRWVRAARRIRSTRATTTKRCICRCRATASTSTASSPPRSATPTPA